MGKTLGEIEISNFSISPKYRIKNWNNAKREGEWNLAAKIFYDRIESRYLKPVRLIANDDKIGEFSGFAILAIDCLIIETLNQFYNGLDETKGKHWKAFWHIFKKSPHFKPFFNRKKTEIFYSHFRCGILHQAQTKANSLVRIDHSEMIEEALSKFEDAPPNEISKIHPGLEASRWHIEKIELNLTDTSLMNPLVPLKIAYEFIACHLGASICASEPQLEEIKNALSIHDTDNDCFQVDRLIAKEYKPFHGIVFEGNKPHAQVQIRLFGWLAFRVHFKRLRVHEPRCVYTHFLDKNLEDLQMVEDNN